MSSISKSYCVLLVAVLAVSSLIVAGSVSAQTIPEPSVPTFTLRFIDKSYDVPPTTTSTTDPYNGKTTTDSVSGYHVKNFIIEVNITNQVFPSTIDGKPAELHYNVRIKGNFGQDWTEQYVYSNGTITAPAQSSSDYTVLSFPADFSSGDQVDFQVEAIIGHYYDQYIPEHPGIGPMQLVASQSSGWSPTQTFTIPNVDDSGGQNSTAFIVEVSIVAVLLLFAALIFVAFKLKSRKNVETKQQKTSKP